MTFKELYGDKSNEVYNGNLDILNQNLTSLEGIYKEINGNFNCSFNKLKSFKYCPNIKGNFYCLGNNITHFTNKRYFKNVKLDNDIKQKYIEYTKINFTQYFI